MSSSSFGLPVILRAFSNRASESRSAIDVEGVIVVLCEDEVLDCFTFEGEEFEVESSFVTALGDDALDDFDTGNKIPTEQSTRSLTLCLSVEEGDKGELEDEVFISLFVIFVSKFKSDDFGAKVQWRNVHSNFSISAIVFL